MKAFLSVLAAILLVATSAVAQRPDLLDDLVLYYDFDVDTAGVVLDQSGNGNIGTIYGATWTPDGICGGAMDFEADDAGDRIDAGNVQDMLGIGKTYAMWMKRESLGLAAIMTKNPHDASPSTGVKLRAAPDNSFTLLCSGFTSADATDVLGYFDGLQDTWVFVTVVLEADLVARIYKNGVLQTPTAGGTYVPAPENNETLVIGRELRVNSSWYNYFDGVLDELMIFDRALTPAEILQLYRACYEPDPCVTKIQLSNDPLGDQDVTDFLWDETLHIRIKDVLMDARDPTCSMAVKFLQKRKWAIPKRKTSFKLDLEPQVDGSFGGSVPLDQFGAGVVRLDITGKQKGGGEKLSRRLHIFVFPTAP